MRFFVLLLFVITSFVAFSQKDQAFLVEDIRVKGNVSTSEDAIITLSRLKIGDRLLVPSPKVQRAIKRLLAEGVFYDIEVTRVDVSDKNVLQIALKEYFVLGKVSYEGLNSSEINKLRKNPRLSKLERYSPNVLSIIKDEVKKLLYAKGYKDVEIKQEANTNEVGFIDLKIRIAKGSRLKIGKLHVSGNKEISSTKLLKQLNKNERLPAFKSGKVYKNDNKSLQKRILQVYMNNGFLDAEILSFSTQKRDSKVDFYIHVNEGLVYSLKRVLFEGNKHFTSDELTAVVKPLLNKPYQKNKLEQYLFFLENRQDITSLYLDHSYANFKLKFRVSYTDEQTVIVNVEMDEGKQYEFGKINFEGNVRTKDKVLHHSVITTAGEPFSRSKIILSQNKLMQLDYFVPEQFNVEMDIDTSAKEVDLTYQLKERISDRFLVSGGFDGNFLVGTLGFDFKNFALRDVFRKGARWNPLPAGGGQHLSIKAQSDATSYYGFSFLFEEPRLKNKRIGLSLSTDYAKYFNDLEGSLDLVSSQVGISHFPIRKNPFLRLTHRLSYRYYAPENYAVFGFENGFYNALTYNLTLEQNTTNNVYYPTTGSVLKLEGVTTAPTSFLKKDLANLSEQDKYRWLEYYQFVASAKKYISLGKQKKTVLAATAGAGYLARYNSQLDIVPFERFEMGGTGITNFSINANRIIGLRGYEAGALSNEGGDPIVVKTSVELRRKLLSFEKWMMTGHLFYENGNTFSLGEPLGLNHASGIGARLFIPMLGVVGVDCGWGFNRSDFDWKEPTFQFTIGLDVGDF